VLPRANHYVQNDQPREFAHVVQASLSNTSPVTPGPVSDELGAPVFVDRSRSQLPSASDVLSRGQG